MKNKRKQTAMEYAPMPGSRITREGAAVVGSELTKIHSSYGCIKPEIVVRTAESARSPLHGYFTWDDTIAAREHIRIRSIANGH